MLKEKTNMPKRRLMSTGTSSSLLGGSSSRDSRAQLPMLSEDRRMNLSDIIIWRKFTRNLRQRVQERQGEKRTFCWLDRSMSRDTRREDDSPKEEPTYRMQPQEKLPIPECKRIIDEYLYEKLSPITYDEKQCNNLSREMAEEVKENLKSVWPKRYKCISFVSLGQKSGQGIRVSSQCAWDPSSDSYVACSFQNETLFCVVMVFAVYYE